MRLLTAIILVFVCNASFAGGTIPYGYHRVANDYKVPSKVLFAIGLQESGKKHEGKFLPYPWTLNIKGKGYRFASFEHACVALKIALKQRYSTDVGMMQIHWQSHGHRLGKNVNPCALLNPEINVKMGALVLREQLNRSPNDVWKAVGRYHSPGNARLQTRYVSLVKKRYRMI